MNGNGAITNSNVGDINLLAKRGGDFLDETEETEDLEVEQDCLEQSNEGEELEADSDDDSSSLMQL